MLPEDLSLSTLCGPSQRIDRAGRLTNSSSLFDMDGTLVSDSSGHTGKDLLMILNQVDSTPGVIGAWESFATTYPGLNVQDILSRMILIWPHPHVTKALHSFYRGTWSPNR